MLLLQALHIGSSEIEKDKSQGSYSSYPGQLRVADDPGSGSFGHATLCEDQGGVWEKHVQHFNMLQHGPRNADKKAAVVIGSTGPLKDNGGHGGACSNNANLENG